MHPYQSPASDSSDSTSAPVHSELLNILYNENELVGRIETVVKARMLRSLHTSLPVPRKVAEEHYQKFERFTDRVRTVVDQLREEIHAVLGSADNRDPEKMALAVEQAIQSAQAKIRAHVETKVAEGNGPVVQAMQTVSAALERLILLNDLREDRFWEALEQAEGDLRADRFFTIEKPPEPVIAVTFSDRDPPNVWAAVGKGEETSAMEGPKEEAAAFPWSWSDDDLFAVHKLPQLRRSIRSKDAFLEHWRETMSGLIQGFDRWQEACRRVIPEGKYLLDDYQRTAMSRTQALDAMKERFIDHLQSDITGLILGDFARQHLFYGDNVETRERNVVTNLRMFCKIPGTPDPVFIDESVAGFYQAFKESELVPYHATDRSCVSQTACAYIVGAEKHIAPVSKTDRRLALSRGLVYEVDFQEEIVAGLAPLLVDASFRQMYVHDIHECIQLLQREVGMIADAYPEGTGAQSAGEFVLYWKELLHHALACVRGFKFPDIPPAVLVEIKNLAGRTIARNIREIVLFYPHVHGHTLDEQYAEALQDFYPHPPEEQHATAQQSDADQADVSILGKTPVQPVTREVLLAAWEEVVDRMDAKMCTMPFVVNPIPGMSVSELLQIDFETIREKGLEIINQHATAPVFSKKKFPELKARLIGQFHWMLEGVMQPANPKLKEMFLSFSAEIDTMIASVQRRTTYCADDLENRREDILTPTEEFKKLTSDLWNASALERVTWSDTVISREHDYEAAREQCRQRIQNIFEQLPSSLTQEQCQSYLSSVLSIMSLLESALPSWIELSVRRSYARSFAVLCDSAERTILSRFTADQRTKKQIQASTDTTVPEKQPEQPATREQLQEAWESALDRVTVRFGKMPFIILKKPEEAIHVLDFDQTRRNGLAIIEQYCAAGPVGKKRMRALGIELERCFRGLDDVAGDPQAQRLMQCLGGICRREVQATLAAMIAGTARSSRPVIEASDTPITTLAVGTVQCLLQALSKKHMTREPELLKRLRAEAMADHRIADALTACYERLDRRIDAAFAELPHRVTLRQCLNFAALFRKEMEQTFAGHTLAPEFWRSNLEENLRLCEAFERKLRERFAAVEEAQEVAPDPDDGQVLSSAEALVAEMPREEPTTTKQALIALLVNVRKLMPTCFTDAQRERLSTLAPEIAAQFYFGAERREQYIREQIINPLLERPTQEQCRASIERILKEAAPLRQLAPSLPPDMTEALEREFRDQWTEVERRLAELFPVKEQSESTVPQSTIMRPFEIFFQEVESAVFSESVADILRRKREVFDAVCRAFPASVTIDEARDMVRRLRTDFSQARHIQSTLDSKHVQSIEDDFARFLAAIESRLPTLFKPMKKQRTTEPVETAEHASQCTTSKEVLRSFLLDLEEAAAPERAASLGNQATGSAYEQEHRACVQKIRQIFCALPPFVTEEQCRRFLVEARGAMLPLDRVDGFSPAIRGGYGRSLDLICECAQRAVGRSIARAERGEEHREAQGKGIKRTEVQEAMQRLLIDIGKEGQKKFAGAELSSFDEAWRLYGTEMARIEKMHCPERFLTDLDFIPFEDFACIVSDRACSSITPRKGEDWLMDEFPKRLSILLSKLKKKVPMAPLRPREPGTLTRKQVVEEIVNLRPALEGQLASIPGRPANKTVRVKAGSSIMAVRSNVIRHCPEPLRAPEDLQIIRTNIQHVETDAALRQTDPYERESSLAVARALKALLAELETRLIAGEQAAPEVSAPTQRDTSSEEESEPEAKNGQSPKEASADVPQRTLAQWWRTVRKAAKERLEGIVIHAKITPEECCGSVLALQPDLPTVQGGRLASAKACAAFIASLKQGIQAMPPECAIGGVTVHVPDALCSFLLGQVARMEEDLLARWLPERAETDGEPSGEAEPLSRADRLCDVMALYDIAPERMAERLAQALADHAGHAAAGALTAHSARLPDDDFERNAEALRQWIESVRAAALSRLVADDATSLTPDRLSTAAAHVWTGMPCEGGVDPTIEGALHAAMSERASALSVQGESMALLEYIMERGGNGVHGFEAAMSLLRAARGQERQRRIEERVKQCEQLGTATLEQLSAQMTRLAGQACAAPSGQARVDACEELERLITFMRTIEQMGAQSSDRSVSSSDSTET